MVLIVSHVHFAVRPPILRDLGPEEGLGIGHLIPVVGLRVIRAVDVLAIVLCEVVSRKSADSVLV